MLRPCLEPRCPKVTDETYCQQHGRGSSSDQGYGAEHRKWRAEVLRLHPVCPCGEPSKAADHRIALSDGGTWDPATNGQGFCIHCHNRKTALTGRRNVARSKPLSPEPAASFNLR